MNYLEIGGQSYPVLYGWGAIMEYERVTGKSALSLLEGLVEPSVTDCFSLIAAGLSNAADELGSPVEYTAKGVARMCKEMKPSQVGEMITRAMTLLREAFPQEDGEAKKKTVTMPQNRAARRKTG